MQAPPGYMVVDDGGGVGQLTASSSWSSPALRGLLNLALGSVAIYAGMQTSRDFPKWTLYVGGGAHLLLGAAKILRPGGGMAGLG